MLYSCSRRFLAYIYMKVFSPDQSGASGMTAFSSITGLPLLRLLGKVHQCKVDGLAGLSLA